MEIFASQKKVLQLSSPDGKYMGYLHEGDIANNFVGITILYEVCNQNLIHKKTLTGYGFFVSSTKILLFLDPSGYGHTEDTGYIYDILDDKISSLYYDNIELIKDNYTPTKFLDLEANILITRNFIIIKSFSNVLFFSLQVLLIDLKLELQYTFDVREYGITDVKELVSFDEGNCILKFSSSEVIKSLSIKFKHQGIMSELPLDLVLNSVNYQGVAVVHDSYLVAINTDGLLTYKRGETSEMLYNLKYTNELRNITALTDLMCTQLLKYVEENGNISCDKTSDMDRLEEYLNKFDVIIPIPSSNPTVVNYLNKLWLNFSVRTGINIDFSYLQKIKVTIPIKKIKDYSKKIEILNNSLYVNDLRYAGKNVLLVDDTFNTGATLEVVCKKLKLEGRVNNIFALVVVKFRMGQIGSLISE